MIFFFISFSSCWKNTLANDCMYKWLLNLTASSIILENMFDIKTVKEFIAKRFGLTCKVFLRKIIIEFPGKNYFRVDGVIHENFKRKWKLFWFLCFFFFYKYLRCFCNRINRKFPFLSKAVVQSNTKVFCSKLGVKY